MLRGLADRRVAVVVVNDEAAQRRGNISVKALEAAGAAAQVLSGAELPDSDFASGRYAALVLVGDGGSRAPAPRVVQLTREFLATEKPIAVWGGLRAIREAAGGGGREVDGGA